MTTYRYLTPAEWGMTWKRAAVPEKLNDPEAYIHHAGGAAWMHDDAVTVFRQLNTYAQQGKGYSAVDYDILVHYSRGQDVVTIGGARCEWMSAATADRNELGEAICLCADTDEREPLPVELEGIARAVVIGIDKGWIARDAKILGHRDNPAHPNATACPGRYLYAQLPWIRNRVAQLLAPAPIPEPSPSPTPAPTPAIIEGAIDMAAAIAHEAGRDTFWYTPNGLRRYPVTSMDHIGTLLNMGAVDAVTGVKLTGSNWTGATVLSVAQLDSRLGPVG